METDISYKITNSTCANFFERALDPVSAAADLGLFSSHKVLTPSIMVWTNSTSLYPNLEIYEETHPEIGFWELLKTFILKIVFYTLF